MDEDIKESENSRKVVPPFPLVAIRSIVYSIVNKNGIKKGITLKATHILSYSAYLFMKIILKSISEDAKSHDKFVITKQQIIDACIKEQRLRFIVIRLKLPELQPYFGFQPNELTRRLVNSKISTPTPYVIPFVAPYPPGRSQNSEDKITSRENDNTNEVISVLVKAVSSYMKSVPSFFDENTQRLNK